MFISVWAEYDINGNFGGNNDQDIFEVDDSLSESVIDYLVVERLKSVTGLDAEDLEDLYCWETVNIKKLGS